MKIRNERMKIEIKYFLPMVRRGGQGCQTPPPPARPKLWTALPMARHGSLWNPMDPYGFQWAPIGSNGFSLSRGAKTLDFEHLDTLFLCRSVHFFILSNFSERYKGRKCLQRSKPCFTMRFKGFRGPLSPREGAKTLDFDHFNTIFLCRSVHFVVLGHFLERYRGRKCVQRSKPCFTMRNQRF